MYRTGLDARGFARQGTTIAPQQLWLDCLANIEAVGAFCVRRRAWDRVKRLAVHGPHPGEMEYYGNWHRHALTEAARRGLLQVRKADNDRALSVIELAAEAVARVGALHPDFQPGSDQITTSLCQYDSLAGLFGMDAAGQADGAHYYPNAAKYEERRTWPILDEVVSNPALRELFDADDTQLAEIMRTWVEGASKESAWGWHFGGVGPAVTFLAKHGPPPNP